MFVKSRYLEAIRPEFSEGLVLKLIQFDLEWIWGMVYNEWAGISQVDMLIQNAIQFIFLSP